MLDFHASRTFYIWRRKRDLNLSPIAELFVDTLFSRRVHELVYDFCAIQGDEGFEEGL